jgi:hypothetical protein
MSRRCCHDLYTETEKNRENFVRMDRLVADLAVAVALYNVELFLTHKTNRKSFYSPNGVSTAFRFRLLIIVRKTVNSM